VREPRHRVPVAGGPFEGHRKGPFEGLVAYHTQHLAIAKEMGDRVEEGGAYGNLGCAYDSQGDHAKVIEYHTQCLAIAKEVGDQAGEGKAYGNLGNAYKSWGDFSKAIEHHTQHLAIAKEVGDRAGEGKEYARLGTCHLYLNESNLSPTSKHSIVRGQSSVLRTCSPTQRSTWVSPSPSTSGQVARALPLVLTKPLD
jgi:tetratricopeptide (TPR) repeat protein